jgi:hydrogenase maturation factor
MRVASLDQSVGLARCIDASGDESDVMIALVPDVQIGDRLLVHAATALARLEANGRESE